MKVYEEIIDFIAAGSTPAEVANFAASSETKERVADLIYREKTVGLDSEETDELHQFLQAEHLIRLAKARARQRIAP